MTGSNSDDIVPASGDIAIIGEGSLNSQPISLQVVQNIFHELTGKSEELSKSFSDYFKIEFSDLEQLDRRISQCIEQYNIKAENFTAKLFYINDTESTFTSFEKFRLLNSGSVNPVESVLFTYNFLIILPKVKIPQSYTVTIRLGSKVTIENRMRSDRFLMPNILIKLNRNRHAVVSIKYIDYMVARNILNVVDEWMNSVKKSHNSKIIMYLQRYSHFIPDVFKYTLVFIGFLSAIQAIPLLLKINPSFEKFGYIALVISFGLFALYQFGVQFGKSTERAVDGWDTISYLKLTEGDSQEISKAISHNKRKLLHSFSNLIITVLVGVLTRVIATWLLGI